MPPPLLYKYVTGQTTLYTRAVLRTVNERSTESNSRFYGQDVVGIVHTIRVTSFKTGQIPNFYEKYCTVFKYTNVQDTFSFEFEWNIICIIDTRV